MQNNNLESQLGYFRFVPANQLWSYAVKEIPCVLDSMCKTSLLCRFRSPGLGLLPNVA